MILNELLTCSLILNNFILIRNGKHILEDLWNVEQKCLSEYYYSIFCRAISILFFLENAPHKFMGYNSKPQTTK